MMILLAHQIEGSSPVIKSRNPFFRVLAKNRRLTEKYRPIRENGFFYWLREGLERQWMIME